MEAVAFVEVLDRRGQVRARQPIVELPAAIGRDYHNAVILDDRWASAVHARITRDAEGRLVIEDAGSENGLFQAGGGGPIQRVAIDGAAVVRVGRTFLRIVDPMSPVPPALRYGARLPGIDGWLETPAVAFTAAALVTAVAAWEAWAGHGDPSDASSIVGTTITAVGALVVWAGTWAFAGRGSAPGGRFLGHLAVASAVALAFIGIITGAEYAAFLWPGTRSVGAITFALAVAILALLFAGHLLINTRLRRGRLLATSVAIAVTIVTLAALSLSDTGGSDTGFSSTLKPLRASIIPVEDASRFFDQLPAIKSRVYSLASDTTS
ncbi:MAG: FHA domain-containing protein [Gemmatimonadales bacterium]